MQRGPNQAIYWAQPAQTYVPPPPAFSFAPTVPVQPPGIAELTQCVQQLTLEIAEIKRDRNDWVQAGRRQQPQKQQRRDRSRQQSRSRARRHPDIWNYHQRFGEAAWRCEAPCFFADISVTTHFIKADSSKKRKRCKHCSTPSKEKRTINYCGTCNIYLCVNGFEPFHTKRAL